MENKYPPSPKLLKSPEPGSNIIPFPKKVDKAEEAADLMPRLDGFIQEIVSQGICHKILIEGLFVRWLHVAARLAGYSDDFLAAQINQSGILMTALLFRINEIERTIPDNPEEHIC